MSLDGNPVFEGGLVIPFVVRLVTMFAPTVREIAKRSPNEFELSLKQETDGGRREEVYLRKDQLVSKLQPLSSVGREVFAPLGLDTWVPGPHERPSAGRRPWARRRRRRTRERRHCSARASLAGASFAAAPSQSRTVGPIRTCRRRRRRRARSCRPPGLEPRAPRKLTRLGPFL